MDAKVIKRDGKYYVVVGEAAIYTSALPDDCDSYIDQIADHRLAVTAGGDMVVCPFCGKRWRVLR